MAYHCLSSGAAPNKAVEPTPSSLRCATAFGHGSPLAVLPASRGKGEGGRRGRGAAPGPKPRSSQFHVRIFVTELEYGPRPTGANHRHRGDAMPKIKHIALSTQDVDKTAKFY